MTLILANLILGAGLGAVYAAATAALAATDDADKASAVTISGVVGVTALLIMAVPEANHSLQEGTGFLLMALCCLVAWPLVRRLPDGPATPGVAPTGAGKKPAMTWAKPSVLLLAGTALLWAVTQGAWSYAAVLGRQHTGMSHTAVSSVLAISSVVALAGAVAGPAAARRFGRMWSMAAFVVAQAVAMAVLIPTHEPVLFIVALRLTAPGRLATGQTLTDAALVDCRRLVLGCLVGVVGSGRCSFPSAGGELVGWARRRRGRWC